MNSSSNPFRLGLLADKPADPCTIVIFGATGDLAQRKLFPALMHLAHEGRLADQTVLVGLSRKALDETEFRKTVLESAIKFAPDSPRHEEFLKRFASRIFVLEEDTNATGPFERMNGLLDQLAQQFSTGGNVLFYLSLPPTVYQPIVRRIADSGLAKPKPGSWTRIIVEKPFGRDLSSASELNTTLAEAFQEEQIYRIDHYLGKETVQNLIVLRLANALFEPLWNHHYIDHVQITAAESLGVEDRAAYYEESGALRDMIQNHLFQILALIAMEPPANLSAESIRDEKNKALAAIRHYGYTDMQKFVIRGQYTSGAVAGKLVPGYLEEHGVSPKSHTETFCALKLFVDNWRWTGVPFYIRTGKRLAKRVTEVAIQFKSVPHQVFEASPLDRIEQNVLAIRIQPNEGISLKFAAKMPGYALHLSPVDMEMRYGTSFGSRISDAYERLLHDAMLGDPTLYARRDAVEQGWKFATPILEAWEAEKSNGMTQYMGGSWGPSEADFMIAADGRRWRKL